ncbi:hypothetical protein Rhe02_66150 [Rhizocola hellebori]|uniref:SigB/SigF/SigG family RNA polymerase sigma factor n=1 Tax=Rhizocola hellebori TaxID=1392758 RepID=A0A8J3VK14_9ACTN|nr:SigB/SigF/SigG family RNA polymerase sigma factor [Rhizocola hellebori]GIH08548.1 hypothetical protein Rhe02_66150 [Rhizocola hellebori]
MVSVSIDTLHEADLLADEALQRLCEAKADDPELPRLRTEAIAAFTPMARRTALKFQRRGEDLEDLVQVALIGLIKSVDRYEPERGVHFVHYAVPTMIGELKRHFRDKAWTVRVNRGLQELHLRIIKAIPDLSQRLQRTPTTADLAGFLEIDEEDIRQGMRCAGAYSTRSLSDLVPGSSDIELSEMMGEQDRELELVPDRLALHEVVARLPEREQQILRLRFMDNLTQAEIATMIGVSQMHVSRLLAKAFQELREMLLTD